MNKTGTSTLKHCFQALGLTPIASPTTYVREERKQIRHFLQHKNYVEMLDLAENYKSFEDRPWNMWSMYRRLHERFPDSLFILTVRDTESWWRSTEHWITIRKPKVLPLYQLHLRVQQLSKESMIASYLRYHAEVESYFEGTGKLLTMNFEQGDGWDKLCNFLAVSVPQEEFPHANKQKYTVEDAKAHTAKSRLKHGLECQACHHLTVIRKNRPSKGKRKSPGSKFVYSSVLRRRIRQRVRKISPEKLRNSVTGRQIFYGTHRLLRSLKMSLPNSFNGARRRQKSRISRNELAVVSCLFNPNDSPARIKNFRTFLAGVKASGVQCLVVELAFGSSPFQIVDHDPVIRVRTDSVLWHKERLLNIGIQQLLSEGVKKIVWLDGDIVFEEPDWPEEISGRLEHANLCQIFDSVSIQAHREGPPTVAPSSVKYFRENGRLFTQAPVRIKDLLRGMLKGGQSGFGWAARSEVLEKVLLFENAIVGGADKLMLAASLADDLTDNRFGSLTRSNIPCSACGHRNRSVEYSINVMQWAQQWSVAVNGEVDYGRLHIRDMYHGRRSDKGYMKRHDILYRHKFDPATDLKSGASGCLEWSSSQRQLRREVEAYFLSRRDDV